ncbi:hypothetical protein EW146_g5806 [Bondarzewia mesenterica]|uniref:Uncharacterized protein n=1 Tax=Bondarzewia mesenterica TaxID=1095465 RepID=A0A4S4LQC3_9AGAM|nr:hypothetical protein EW146_g5806 [Bondarzewia mesenterica]
MSIFRCFLTDPMHRTVRRSHPRVARVFFYFDLTYIFHKLNVWDLKLRREYQTHPSQSPNGRYVMTSPVLDTMLSPHEEQINRLCSRGDVQTKAFSLYNTLRTTTALGSGYDLGPAAQGLPSICSFIASQDVGSDDVSETVARTAACLNQRVWRNALKTARAALEAYAQRTKYTQSAVMSNYRELVDKYKIGRPARVASWMIEVEETLVGSPAYRRSCSKLNVVSLDVKITVFFWLSRVLNLKQVKPQPEPFLDEYGVDIKTFTLLSKLADKACSALRARIEGTIAELRARGTTTSPSKPSTPGIKRHPSTQNSPTKSALRDTQSATPSQGTKRKVAFSDPSISGNSDDEDDEVYVPESPSKRQKLSSPYKTPKTLTAQEIYKYPMPPPPPELVMSSSKPALEDVEMGGPESGPEFLQHVAGPSTSRSISQSNADGPTYMYRTRASNRTEEIDFPSFDDEEQVQDDDNLPFHRRFRPVLLSYAQWEKRAPRLEEESAIAQKKMQDMVRKWGHPFEWMRSEVGR